MTQQFITMTITITVKIPVPPTPPAEAAEKVDTTAYIWYNVIIKYRRWYHG